MKDTNKTLTAQNTKAVLPTEVPDLSRIFGLVWQPCPARPHLRLNLTYGVLAQLAVVGPQWIP